LLYPFVRFWRDVDKIQELSAQSRVPVPLGCAMSGDMVHSSPRTEILVAQLNDPSRCDQALIAIIGEGKGAVPSLTNFLRSSKASSLPQARLLAVEGLGILKGPAALDALTEVAQQNLAEISDPAIRLAEESVASRAALALADFTEARARSALLQLLETKPLRGVAEAFEKLKDPRAVPSLVRWLNEDFVSEAAARAITASGSIAVPVLLTSLRENRSRLEVEAGASQRRRARILQILSELALPGSIDNLDDLLEDASEAVRLNTVRLLLNGGTIGQQRKAYRAGLNLLQSSHDHSLQVDCEELLTAHFAVGAELVEEAIDRRRLLGESQEFWPRETALTLLSRIRRKGRMARRQFVE
jgi:HEAT repeat protein